MKTILLLALTVAALAGPMSAGWLDYPVTADTFSGNGSLKWSADLNAYGSSMSYVVLNGDTCVISLALLGTEVTGFGTALKIKLPPGIMAARYVYGNAHVDGIGEASGDVAMVVSDDEPYLLISPWHGVIDHPTGQVNITGQITFPVCYGSVPCAGGPKRRAVKH